MGKSINRINDTSESASLCANSRPFGQSGNEFGERLVAGIAVATLPDRDGAALLLAVTDDEHHRQSGELGIADLAADRLGAQVDVDPQAGLAQS